MQYANPTKGLSLVDTSYIFSILRGSISVELSLRSPARMTPSFTLIANALDPNYYLGANKSTLMASMAYSTWKSLPSGENVLTPRSYSLLRDKGWTDTYFET